MVESGNDRFHRHFVVALAFFSAAFFVALGFWPPSPTPTRAPATQAFRQRQLHCQEALATVSELLDTIHHVSEAEQIELMGAALSVLEDGILPFARMKERFVYAAVDRIQPHDPHALTGKLRAEHRLMERWFGEMRAMAEAPLFDHNPFCDRGQRLLGLLEAHLEAENEILLPMLDEAMTAEEFQARISNREGLE